IVPLPTAPGGHRPELPSEIFLYRTRETLDADGPPRVRYFPQRGRSRAGWVLRFLYSSTCFRPLDFVARMPVVRHPPVSSFPVPCSPTAPSSSISSIPREYRVS